VRSQASSREKRKYDEVEKILASPCMADASCVSMTLEYGGPVDLKCIETL